MKEKKNIDRLYQEKFKDFEKDPGERVWKNIASKLDKKEEKKPIVIPLWMKLGSAAAVMALVIGSLLYTTNENSLSGEPDVVFENPDKSSGNLESDQPANTEIKKNTNSEKIVFENAGGHLNTENSRGSSKSAALTNTQEESPDLRSKRTRNADQTSQQTSADHEDVATRNKNKSIASALSEGIRNKKFPIQIVAMDQLPLESFSSSRPTQENVLAGIERELKEKKEVDLIENSKRKMRLSTFAAPVMYKNMGSGNELSNQFAANSSSSDVTFSYGVKIAYQISDKLRIRTGISKVNIQNNIADISYSPTAITTGFENIDLIDGQLGLRAITPDENGLPMGMGRDNSVTGGVITMGKINQQFGFIEVPLEIELSVIDRQFGLNIIGGGSSLFLDRNRVDLFSESGRTELGKASNINKTSFSTNIGLGLDYKLSSKFSLSIEPILKYQLNTFDRVENVQPVNFGVYSGFNFRF